SSTAVVLLAASVFQLTRSGAGPGGPALFIGGLFLAAQAFPLIVYLGVESEAVAFDEGVFVIAAALLPGRTVVAIAAGTTILMQTARRRPPIKALFNISLITLSAAGGAAVAHLGGLPTDTVTLNGAFALAAGALTFSALNAF